MDFIASHPLVWLFCAVLFAIVAIILQAANMKKSTKDFSKAFLGSADIGHEIPNGMFGRFVPVAIFGILASVSSIMFAVAAIAYFVK